jgi:hypothetical protein
MTKSLNLGHSVDASSLADMSKSLAGFHLTAAGGAGNKAMHESTMDQVPLSFISNIGFPSNKQVWAAPVSRN